MSASRLYNTAVEPTSFAGGSRASRIRKRISLGRAAPLPLKDGKVTLRLAGDEDIERLVTYGSDPNLLEGIWIPGPPPTSDVREWAKELVVELCGGWTDRGGIYGGGLVVDELEPFLGIVFLSPVQDNGVELSYGVLPSARERGIATSAAGLTTSWALTSGGFDRVELRIDQDQAVSQHIAKNLGFELKERIETYVQGTGLTHMDLLYMKRREDSG